MTAQLSLLANSGDDACDYAGDLRRQFQRLDQETRVWLDSMLGRGATLTFIEEPDSDRMRLEAAERAGLKLRRETRARGLRRAWYRARREGDPIGFWPYRDGEHWTFVRYEPRLEREIGAKAEPSDHERAKRTHWRAP